MKINLIGTSGSGKTTLASLAANTRCPFRYREVIIQRRAAWQGTPDDRFLIKLETALNASPDWVLDGNYNRTRTIKWREIDLIVWVDYGFARTLWQAISRAAKRALTQQELWPDTGNRESFRRAFFSRESVLLWTIKTWRSNRVRYIADMENPKYAHIRFVRITSRQDAENLITELKSSL